MTQGHEGSPLPQDRARDDDAGRAELTELYARLRRIAGRLMQDERDGHTLCPTEVVHEAIARVLSRPPRAGGPGPLIELIDRVSHVMRQVLVDHARRRIAAKRGGGRGRFSLNQLDDAEAAIESPHFNWAVLDRALNTLATHDPRRHRVVLLRFFGGLDNRQIARELAVDERTVGRDWLAARTWIKKQLEKDE